MKERPILFSAPMVRAVIAGTKTQTRRVVKPQPPSVEAVRSISGSDFSIFHAKVDGAFRVAGPVWAVRYAMGREPEWLCPYGQPGERLCLLSSWATDKRFDGLRPKDLPIDGDDAPAEWGKSVFWTRWDGTEKPAWCGKLRPGRFLPSSLRWLMPLAEVTGVRVERLHDITEEDARAEGVTPAPFCKAGRPAGQEHVESFDGLWREINGVESWDANPWVWVVNFKRIEARAENGGTK